ncbi:MAG: hypothetical protein WCI05_14130 [Myxococcales bacterium]|jgi:hypothetical protein
MRDRIELRAQNPVARCLLGQLIVPRIYYQVDWPQIADGPIDVLAIDRDGVGEAHLVDIRRNAPDALARIARLHKARAPFRWVAFLKGTEDETTVATLNAQEILYPADTAGRIGVFEIVEIAGGDLGANIRIKAERFPTPSYDLAAAFIASHQATIQFGGA